MILHSTRAVDEAPKSWKEIKICGESLPRLDLDEMTIIAADAVLWGRGAYVRRIN